MDDSTMINHRLLKNHTHALVAAENLERLPASIPHTRLAHGVLQDSVQSMPSLIELSALNDKDSLALLEQMQAEVDRGELPVICSLLRTEYDTPRFQSHFARVQICRNSRGERAWLRLHDPRVWVQLPRVLKMSTLEKISIALQHWTFYYAGEWITNTLDDYKQDTPLRNVTSSLVVDGPEWAALGRVGAVNRSLSRLGIDTTYSEALRHSALIDSLIARAQAVYGLRRLEDLLNFASLGWCIHPRFDEHSCVIEAVQNHHDGVKSGDVEDDTSVVDSIMALDPEAFEAIRRDLKQKTVEQTGRN
jgi:hypothetical protein